MVKRIGGLKRKTRHKLQKSRSQRGKISIRKYFQSFDLGDRVCLNAEPAVHKGMYNLRFHSKIGKVTGKRGGCYQVKIKDINKEKILVVHPVHLKKA